MGKGLLLAVLFHVKMIRRYYDEILDERKEK